MHAQLLGEPVRLTVGHINLDGGAQHLAELSRSRRKRPRRTVELTEESLAALRERLARFARRAQTRPHCAPAEVEHLGQGSVSGPQCASFT